MKLCLSTRLSLWLAVVLVLPWAAAQELPVLPALRIDGANFAIADLRSGARAFDNRDYTWQDVPERFQGWQFTQTSGGRAALIRFVVPQDGWAFMATATSQGGLAATGWERLPDAGFWYTDGGKTRMAVYRRSCRSGEKVTVPQGNWTGGLVLAPQLAQGETVEVMYPPPPGIVISRSPDPQRVYVGSPSLAILPDGAYVASHDWFGSGTSSDTTAVFVSHNRGLNWEPVAEIRGQFWSTLFVHRGALYIMGADGVYGRTVIRRSTDGGRTWTSPDGATTGCLLPERQYHCAPVPVVVHNGRLWRAMEDRFGNEGWGRHFRTFVMSAPEGADLLDAAHWTVSNRLPFERAWGNAPKAGWLEGNVVVSPAGDVLNLLRVESREGGTVAMVHAAADGKTVRFDPATDLRPMPGALHKFTLRYDADSRRYWSLVNKESNPRAVRNVLALISSPDLHDWRVESVLLMHPDRGNHAWQYLDWQIDGTDLIAASRTAWGNSHNFHDANYLTFHRVRDFRTDRRTVD